MPGSATAVKAERNPPLDFPAGLDGSGEGAIISSAPERGGNVLKHGRKAVEGFSRSLTSEFENAWIAALFPGAAIKIIEF